MEIQSVISALLADPNMPVDAEWVLAVMEEHPTFMLPAALLLRRNPDDIDAETRRNLQQRLALGCADRTAMADLADLAGEDWASIYPPEPEPPEPTTESTISAFIDTYGGAQDSDEAALLEKLIFSPVAPDYLQAADDGGLSLKGLVAGDDEPAADEPTPPPYEAPTQTAHNSHIGPVGHDNDSLLSESLAKIFIKQGRYARAYEIISNLSLNYPEKSVYFADQMRFLQKLIINQQFKQQNK